MTWFRCDDQLADHPKVMRLDGKLLPAMGLWLMCGIYSSKHLTDGFVPVKRVRLLGGDKLAKDLVAAGLLEPVDGGWQMHDFLEWNPSAAEVTERRAKRQAAGQAGGQATAQANAAANAQASRSSEAPSKSSTPYPVPVSQVLTEVLPERDSWVEPSDLYEELTGRKPTQKVRDWLEDLHVRFSRKQLVSAMCVVPNPKARDWLRQVDDYLEARAA